MNSEERHNLHKNELEEVIEDMPEMLKKHWIGIAAVVLLVIVVLVSWTALKHTVQKNKKENNQALAKVLVSRSQSQVASAGNSENYNTAAEVSNLAAYAQKAVGTDAGANAMIQQANTIMSELYFSTNYITADDKNTICENAAKVYQAVADKYSKNPVALCQSQIGLASIAAELGQWEKAQDIYNSIIAKKDELANTPFPAMAQTRLSQIEKLEKIEPIEFAPAPEPEAAIENTDEIAPDTDAAPAEETTETEVDDAQAPAQAD